MAESINLLQTTIAPKKERSLFFSISLLFLLISIIVSVGLLLYTTYLNSRISSLSNEKTEVLKQMAIVEPQRIKYLTVKERLRSIGPILLNNTAFSTAYTQLENAIPSGLSISDIDIQKDTVTLTLATNDLVSVNTFLNDNLKALVSKKSLIKAVTINSFTVGKANDGYNLGVTLQYRQNILGQ